MKTIRISDMTMKQTAEGFQETLLNVQFLCHMLKQDLECD